MNGAMTRSGGALRRLTACALMFALVLQGIAFALGGAGLAAGPANAAAAGFELCRHDGGTAGGAPETPAADSHCIFCLAGATYLDTPPAALEFHTITFAALSWSFSAWRLPAATVNASARSRGPPLVA
jgi:hypothetical protein